MTNKPINWNMVISVATVLLVVVGIVGVLQQCPSRAKPVISVSMEYPIKVEADKTYRDTGNPNVIVRNNGPGNAVSLKGDIKIYSYNTELGKVTNYVDMNRDGFDYALYAKTLEPFEDVSASMIGVNGKDLVAVYEVDVSYHRKRDEEEFRLTEYFFTQNKKIFTQDEFQQFEPYLLILESVKSFEPEGPSTRKFEVTAAGDKTWFVESDSLDKARVMEDGELRIIGDPVPQSKEPKPGFPHFVIVPRVFADCDCFIKAEIVDGEMAGKVRYGLTSVGEAVAGITNDGFDVVKEVVPGKEVFSVRKSVFKRGEDDGRSAQELLDVFGRGDEKIVSTIIVMYRAENDPGRLFEVSVTHEISKGYIREIDDPKQYFGE